MQCKNCKPTEGLYLGMTCPECNKPFRVINNMGNEKLIEGYQPEDKLNTNNPPNEYKVEDLFDWNTLSLEQMVEFLERKYMFMNTGEAKCIMELVRFYQINKK